MSTTHHAHVIVGLRLPFSAIKNTEMVRSCDHVHPGKTDDVPFCSQCGNPMWTTKEGFIKEFVNDASGMTLAGIGIVRSVYDDYVFVCGMHCETQLDRNNDGVERFHHTGPREKLVKERIQTAMSKLGLWDESEFGTWLVMTRS